MGLPPALLTFLFITNINNTMATLEEIKQDVKMDLKEGLEEIIFHFHILYKTNSGDASPEQVSKLESLTDELSELIATQIYQNL